MSETKTIEQYEVEALEVLSEIAHNDNGMGERIPAATAILHHVQYMANMRLHKQINGVNDEA